jgi:hypothetical protein
MSQKTGGTREENSLVLVARVGDAFDGVWLAKKRWHLLLHREIRGGLEYNNTLKDWPGAILKPNRNFMMKLTFRQPIKSRDRDEFDKGQIDDNDEYDVTITEEGDAPVSRLESRDKLPSINKYAFLECSRIGLIDYKFNFVNRRFIEIYKGGYINGANDNNDTPKVSGGVCTLAQSTDAPKPSKYSMKSPRRGRRGL